MRKFIFPVHLFARAAFGAGITFSSGNEWYGLHLVATSVTVPVNGAKVAMIQHEHKCEIIGRMMNNMKVETWLYGYAFRSINISTSVVRNLDTYNGNYSFAKASSTAALNEGISLTEISQTIESSRE
jgi:hypothetical protein